MFYNQEVQRLTPSKEEVFQCCEIELEFQRNSNSHFDYKWLTPPKHVYKLENNPLTNCSDAWAKLWYKAWRFKMATFCRKWFIDWKLSKQGKVSHRKASPSPPNLRFLIMNHIDRVNVLKDFPIDGKNQPEEWYELKEILPEGSSKKDAIEYMVQYYLVSSEMEYRDWETDRKSTRLNSSHSAKSRMPSSA